MNYQSAIPQSSLQGSLFELIARGKKDTYFVTDKEGSGSAFNPFYKASTPMLQERRTALISAAVTGQIDVRQHPAN